MKFNDDDDDSGLMPNFLKNLVDTDVNAVPGIAAARAKFVAALRDVASRLEGHNSKEGKDLVKSAVLSSDGAPVPEGAAARASVSPESFVTNTLADLWLHIEKEADPAMFFSCVGLAIRLISLRIGMSPSETTKALANGMSNEQLDF